MISIFVYVQIISEAFKLKSLLLFCFECNTFICDGDEEFMGSTTTENIDHSIAYSRPCTMKQW
jgi:hypothetical protein